MPVVCFVPTEKVGRLLQITRGLHPVVCPTSLLSLDCHGNMLGTAVAHASKLGFCKKGDKVIVVAAEPEGAHGTAYSMKIVCVDSGLV